MMNEISQLKYNSTMTSGMTDVTETAEPVVDVWPYVELLSNQGIVSNYVLENALAFEIGTSPYVLNDIWKRIKELKVTIENQKDITGSSY